MAVAYLNSKYWLLWPSEKHYGWPFTVELLRRMIVCDMRDIVAVLVCCQLIANAQVDLEVGKQEDVWPTCAGRLDCALRNIYCVCITWGLGVWNTFSKYRGEGGFPREKKVYQEAFLTTLELINQNR